jgi:hypothetical protein
MVQVIVNSPEVERALEELKAKMRREGWRGGKENSLAINSKNRQNTRQKKDEDFLPNKNLAQGLIELLSTHGIAKQDAKALTQLVGIARPNPQAALAAVQAALAPAEADQPTWQERVAPEGQTTTAANNIPPPPTEAPAKYTERKNKRHGVDTFILDAYKPWIVPDPKGGSRPVLMLPRKLIEELDPDCDQALTDWPGNHKGQEFPVQIARKNAAREPTAEEKRIASRVNNWSHRTSKKRQREDAASGVTAG